MVQVHSTLRHREDREERFPLLDEIKANEIVKDGFQSYTNKNYEAVAAPASRHCLHCRSKRRLLSFRHLEKGDYIRLPGQNFTFNVPDCIPVVGQKVVAFYHHEAFVKDIKIDRQNDQKAIITLIHFSSLPKPEDRTGTVGIPENPTENAYIFQSEENFDLFRDEIEVYDYRKPRYTKREILRRAERFIGRPGFKKDRYGLFTHNCQHFVTYCIMGGEEPFDGESGEANDVLELLWTHISHISAKIAQFVSQLRYILNIVDDMPLVLDALKSAKVSYFIAAAIAIIYLLYTIKKQYDLYKMKNMGILCNECYMRETSQLWTRFLVFVAISGAGLLILTLLTPLGLPVVLPLAIVINILSIIGIWGIPKLREKLESPFQGAKTEVSEPTQLNPGDVISFKYCGHWHEGMVSEINGVELKVIHYALPGIFCRRVIQEEIIEIDWQNSRIMKHDYTGYRTYSNQEALKRARRRIGEKKHSPVSNRSAHFVHWAKVNEAPPRKEDLEYLVPRFDPEDEIQHPTRATGRGTILTAKGKKSTAFMKCDWIKVIDEVKPSDIVDISYYGLWHRGIVTQLNISQSKLRIIHFGLPNGLFSTRQIIEEWFAVDLKKNDVWVHEYHPSHCFSPDEVIREARSHIGDTGFNTLTNRSSHFAERCKLLPTALTDCFKISSYNQIEISDMICYSYYWLWHMGLVTEVDPENNRMKVVHFGCPDGLFGTREIIEEWVEQDPEAKGGIWIYRYHPSQCHSPEEVIRRAKTIVGSGGFNTFTRRSSHVVKRCKLRKYTLD